MCRFVTVVIFVLCVSFGVLAEGDRIQTKTTCSKDDPNLTAKRLEWQKCFNNTVERHLNPDLPATGDVVCRTASDFGETFDDFIKLVNTQCNTSLSVDSKDLIKLIEFSLRSDSFKKFYDDINCVKRYEYDISNCVKAKVGFFNITEEKRHTTWFAKANLRYDGASCSTSKKVSNCVEAVLHKCKQHTEDYMAKLFDYARSLGNCSSFPVPTPFPSTGGNTAAAAPWLTTPVIITLSVGAVVVVVAIIIIVVMKCKK